MRFILFLLLFVGKGYAQNTKPNILWIVCEDISPTLSMYGDSTAQTPNLNALAAHSTIYEKAFAPVGVCAPARSSLITGMYPTSIGTMHMRTGKDITAHGKREYAAETNTQDQTGKTIREYAAVPPPDVKCFPEYLRAAGYFCTNNNKTDYQFAAPLTAWDENSAKAHWRNRPKGSPFFSVFNFNITHESQLWKQKDKPLTVNPKNVPLPPYFPDDSIVREDVARHYSNIERLDQQVGLLVEALKADGLYDNTIIFFYSDHGGPLPRQKREVYDRGLRVPLFIKDIGQKTSRRAIQLVSFVDFAPTILDMAQVPVPPHFQGFSFYKNEKNERSYVFGSGDRFDEYTDRIRIIRTDSFLYVKNFYPELPKYKDLAYRKQIDGMRQILVLQAQKKLNSVQESWFGNKNNEELYLADQDPHQSKDMAQDAFFQKTLEKHRQLLAVHLDTYGDMGTMPESDMILMMWPGGTQPQTQKPVLRVQKGKIFAHCPSDGSSMAYLVSDKPLEQLERDLPWQLYTQAVPCAKGKYIYFVAERLGYTTSEMALFFEK